MSEKNLKESLGLDTESKQIVRSQSTQPIKAEEIYSTFETEVSNQVDLIAAEIEAQLDPNTLVKLAVRQAVTNTRNKVDLSDFLSRLRSSYS